MQQFKIDKNGFKEIRKQVIIRSIPLLALAATAGIYMSLKNSNDPQSFRNVLPVVIPLAIFALVFGIFKGINRQKLIADSYLLTVTDNLITRKQHNTPEISIYHNAIREITKNNNGSIVIKGTHRYSMR